MTNDFQPPKTYGETLDLLSFLIETQPTHLIGRTKNGTYHIIRINDLNTGILGHLQKTYEIAEYTYDDSTLYKLRTQKGKVLLAYRRYHDKEKMSRITESRQGTETLNKLAEQHLEGYRLPYETSTDDAEEEQ